MDEADARTDPHLAAGALLATTLQAPAAVGLGQRSDGDHPGRVSGIVFISDRDSPSAEEIQDDVYLYDRRTGRTHRMTDNPVVETFPALSPDGRYLGYVADATIYVCPVSYRSGTWTCGASRSVVVNATGGSFVWTPEGHSILYSGTTAGNTDDDVYSIRLFGRHAPRNLTDEAPGVAPTYDGQLTVSPDGRFFVYGHSTTGGGDLYRRSIDGSSPVALTSTDTATEFGAELSPDGSRIAFHSNRRPGQFDTFTMRPVPEGPVNAAVNLTAGIITALGGASNERFPTWSPNGREIAFWWNDVTQNQFGYGEVFLMRADGTSVRNVTANNPSDPTARPIGDIMPDWGWARAKRR